MLCVVAVFAGCFYIELGQQAPFPKERKLDILYLEGYKRKMLVICYSK